MSDFLNKTSLKKLFKDCVTTSNGVEKSVLDEKEFHHFILKNKLNCFYVFDPSAETTYTSLSVSVGSFNESNKYPEGTAHLVEHLLLLNSEKFPKINFYSNFLQSQGGNYNAHTSSEETNYYFNLPSTTKDKFYEILEIFSNFFTQENLYSSKLDQHFEKNNPGNLKKDPTTPNSFENKIDNSKIVENEIKVINEEFEKTLENEIQRMWHVIKKCANQNSNLRNFECGNSTTLTSASKNPAEFANDFYNKFYSSDLMNVVIISKHNFNDNLKSKISQIFSKIKNKNLMETLRTERDLQKSVEKNCFSNVSGKLIRLNTLKSTRTLNIMFHLPPLLYNNPPSSPKELKKNAEKADFDFSYDCCNFLVSLLTSEGKGSLLTFLKEKNLINNIIANVTNKFYNFSLFTITVNCTDEGILNETNLKFIISSIFNYIQHFKVNLNDYFEFYRDILKAQLINFKFKAHHLHPSSILMSLSNKVNFYKYQQAKLDFGNILSVSFIDPKLNLTNLKNFLNVVSEFKNCFCVSLHEHNILENEIKKQESDIKVEDSGIKQDVVQTEPFYKTNFKINSLFGKDENVLDVAKKAKILEQIKVPDKNPFFPESFKVLDFEPFVHEEKVKFLSNFGDVLGKQGHEQLALFEKFASGSFSDQMEERKLNEPWKGNLDLFRPPISSNLYQSKFKVWFKQDVTFQDPLVYVKICLHPSTSVTCFDPKDELKMKLFLKMFDITIIQDKYWINRSGVNFGRYCEKNGNLIFLFQGYENKIKIIILDILKKFFNFEKEILKSKSQTKNTLISIFNREKENYKKEFLRNLKTESALSKAQRTLTNLLSSHKLATSKEKIEILEDLKLEKVLEFGKIFIRQKFKLFEFFGYGNITLSEVKRILKQVHEEIPISINPPRLVSTLPTPKIKDGLGSREGSNPSIKKDVKHLLRLELPNSKSNVEISAVVYSIPLKSNEKEIFLAQIFSFLVRNKFYSEIRTQKNLCYNCFSTLSKIDNVSIFKFGIESKRNDGTLLVNSIHEFVQSLDEKFNDKDLKDKFEGIKGLLISNLLEVPRSMSSEQAEYWSMILNRRAIESKVNFNDFLDSALILASLKLEDLKDFVKRMSRARAVVVCVCAETHQSQKDFKEFEVITDLKKQKFHWLDGRIA